MRECVRSLCGLCVHARVYSLCVCMCVCVCVFALLLKRRCAHYAYVWRCVCVYVHTRARVRMRTQMRFCEDGFTLKHVFGDKAVGAKGVLNTKVRLHTPVRFGKELTKDDGGNSQWITKNKKVCACALSWRQERARATHSL